MQIDSSISLRVSDFAAVREAALCAALSQSARLSATVPEISGA
jgi:hypothetical protein